MHEQDLAIVKALVSVAWADGVFAERERAMLDALLDAYGAGAGGPRRRLRVRRDSGARSTTSIRRSSRPTIAAILLQHAVLLTFADGDQSTGGDRPARRALGEASHPGARGAALLDAGAERAKKSLHLLG